MGSGPTGGLMTRSPRCASWHPTRSYEWVVEGDITACFDEISHPALMDRVRDRIADRRVLGLGEGVPEVRDPVEDGCAGHRTGTPQGWDPVAAAGQRGPVRPGRVLRRPLEPDPRGTGQASPSRTANYRLVRYADDCHGVRAPGARRGPTRRGGRGVVHDGAAPVARTRQRSPTSTRAWTSSAGASSVTVNEAPAGTTSTPIRRRRPSGCTGKVKTICRQDVNLPLESCCIGSTRVAGLDRLLPTRSVDGLPLSAAPSPGDGLDGCDANTARPPGRSSAAATAAAAGGPQGERSCSTPERWGRPATATGARSPAPWPTTSMRSHRRTGLVESPVL